MEVIQYPNQIPIETDSKVKFKNNLPKVKSMIKKGNFVNSVNIHNIREYIFSNQNNGNKKNKIIIFVIIASLLFIGIFVILYLKIFKHLIKKIIKPEKPPISPTLENQEKDIFINNTFRTPLETPLNNIISGYSYEEIESRIGFPII